MAGIDLMSQAPVIAALAVANERLVEAIKNLVSSLCTDLLPQGTGALPSLNDKQKNGWREGIIGLLSIVTGILIALLAFEAGALTGTKNNDYNGCTVLLCGLLIAGSTRLVSPAIKFLQAFSDTKKEHAARSRAAKVS